MIKAVTDLNGNRHEIAIDDELDFLAPYLTKAKKMGVPVWRLKAIKGYYVPEGKQEQQAGATIRDANKKLTMTLLKYHQELKTLKSGKFEVSGWRYAGSSYYFECTLETFAHELSHLVEWNHTAERYVFEKKLQLAFAFLAKKRGYQGYDREAGLTHTSSP